MPTFFLSQRITERGGRKVMRFVRERSVERDRERERAETLKLKGESMDEADDYIKRVKTSNEANTE